MFSDQVLQMLADVLPILKRYEKQCAVGGAVAMGIQGAPRATMDLDVFILDKCRSRILYDIRKLGYQIIPVFEPFHYAAYPRWRTADIDPEVRIDLLFPADDIEVAGIERAEDVTVGRGKAAFSVRVFSPLFLTLSKLYSSQGKHLIDLGMMFNRGMIPMDEVLQILKDNDPDMVKKFLARIKFIERRLTDKPRPKFKTLKKGNRK